MAAGDSPAQKPNESHEAPIDAIFVFSTWPPGQKHACNALWWPLLKMDFIRSTASAADDVNGRVIPAENGAFSYLIWWFIMELPSKKKWPIGCMHNAFVAFKAALLSLYYSFEWQWNGSLFNDLTALGSLRDRRDLREKIKRLLQSRLWAAVVIGRQFLTPPDALCEPITRNNRPQWMQMGPLFPPSKFISGGTHLTALICPFGSFPSFTLVQAPSRGRSAISLAPHFL